MCVCVYVSVYVSVCAFSYSRTCRLSEAGLRTFLLRYDNDIFDHAHRNVVQDMTRPLNHCMLGLVAVAGFGGPSLLMVHSGHVDWINSSHNTYLTGHQLRGQSSVVCETFPEGEIGKSV